MCTIADKRCVQIVSTTEETNEMKLIQVSILE